MPALIEHQKGGNPMLVRLVTGFALLALLLAVIGIYGLIAYSVSQRTRELGIRFALGASTQDVQRMVLKQGMKMTVIGAVVGVVLALPLPQVFASLFFTAHFREPRLYFLVPVVILVAAALASYIPARRASRVDPVVALRYE